MVAKNNVVINVYGKEYSIKTTEDKNSTLEYAEFINQLMQETSKESGFFDAVRVSTLVMLKLTHELFNLKKKISVIEQRVNDDLVKIETEIDSYLNSGELTHKEAELVIEDDDE